MFVNNINGKVYIGQTMTKFYSRFCNHHNDTFTKKDNIPFHNAIRKYGWSNFSRYIIWQDDKIYENNSENKKIVKDILNIKEEEYILKYSSNDPEYGYNATKGGFYLPESARTKEAIEKSKETSTRNHSNYMLGRTYDKHHLAKSVLQYDVDKTLIKEWSCIKLAEDTLNITICLRNITSGGYIWVYNDEDKEKALEDKHNRLLDYTRDRNIKTENLKDYLAGKRVVYCFDLFGDLVGSYNSSSEAGKLFNLSANGIAHAASSREKGNVVGEYIWIYESDLDKKEEIINSIRNSSKIYKSRFKPIYQIFLNGEIIKLWDNFEEIIKENPQSKASINKCLNGKLNAYCNCFWIYEENYSDEILIEKLEKYKKTKKSLVEDIMNGVIKYEGLKPNYDTNNSKNYLKEHPCIYQLDLDYQIVKKWDNYNDTKEFYNFTTISKCLRKQLKTAFGYIWRYEEDVLNNNL